MRYDALHLAAPLEDVDPGLHPDGDFEVRREAVPSIFFFFNDTATPEIYPLPLHDALPISLGGPIIRNRLFFFGSYENDGQTAPGTTFLANNGSQPDSGNVTRVLASDLDALSSYLDRKSTRLNSSHSQISYAVFCLKKKNHT